MMTMARLPGLIRQAQMTMMKVGKPSRVEVEAEAVLGASQVTLSVQVAEAEVVLRVASPWLARSP